MSSHYKAFLVVMVLTLLAYWLARPAFTKFMADEDFVRRRNLWLSLTAAAFLLPNFWLYMGVAAVLIWRAGRRDPNPAALYLFLLLAVPPFAQPVPGFGLVNYFVSLNHFRLLGLALIVPAALSMRRAAKGLYGQATPTTWLAPDVLLVAYAVIQTVLYVPYSPLTGSMRSLFLVAVDVLLPYFVLSRCCTSKPMIVEAIAALALSAVVVAPLALFEAARGWLLYSDIAGHWGIKNDIIGYLVRSDILRAQVTSGQSIVLGAFYAAVLGLWLYLQSDLKAIHRWLGTAAILGGLLASFSRGPWVGAVAVGIAFFAIGPNAISRVFKLVGISAVVFAGLLASPMGASIIDHLPFIGTVDAGNVDYRQAVNDRSWMIIQLNPLFGSPYFGSYMEDLRNGQGLIDLLNAYLSIGMAFGLVTLSIFLMFLATVAYRCLKVARFNAATDPDTSKLGAALLASFLGMLIIIYTVNNYLSVPYIYFGLAALMVAYSRMPLAVVDGAVASSPARESRGARQPFGYRV